jgi:prepilin-type N-terminal cleavage/methylation domain-containing protein
VNRHAGSSHSSFTLIELLVVVAIIAVLVAVLLPALVNARNSASRAVCAGNWHQIGMFFGMYFNEQGEYIPPIIGGDWALNYDWAGHWAGYGALRPYTDPIDPLWTGILPSIDPWPAIRCDLKSRGPFYDAGCPQRYMGYGNALNIFYTLPWATRGDGRRIPSHEMSTVTLGVCQLSHPWTWSPLVSSAHGGTGCNALRPDGHAFWITAERLKRTGDYPGAEGKMSVCNSDY